MPKIKKGVYTSIVSKHLKIDIRHLEANWNSNLTDLGLDSMSLIDLVLSLEEEFNMVFPEEYLVQNTFSSPYTLWNIVEKIGTEVNE